MSTSPTEVELVERLTKEITERLEAEYLKKATDFQKALAEENKQSIEKAIEEWRKSQEEKELSDADLGKLLSQEYETFTVKIPVNDKERSFTLRELPQAIERRFIKNAVEKLKPHLSTIASITEKVIEGTLPTKLEAILAAIEPSMEIMTDTVVLILNPFGKEEDITTAWVEENISTRRQWNIIQAQEKLNGLRNFFSPVSLVSPGKN